MLIILLFSIQSCHIVILGLYHFENQIIFVIIDIEIFNYYQLLKKSELKKKL